MKTAWNASVEQSIFANTRRLAAVSTSVREQYPQGSLLFAAEAVLATRAEERKGQRLQIPEAEQALRDALAASSGFALYGAAGGNNPVAVSPDSHWLILGSTTGPCSLID